jgi:hypothetical protein
LHNFLKAVVCRQIFQNCNVKLCRCDH